MSDPVARLIMMDVDLTVETDHDTEPKEPSCPQD
jgi:hypothetical protein